MSSGVPHCDSYNGEARHGPLSFRTGVVVSCQDDFIPVASDLQSPWDCLAEFNPEVRESSSQGILITVLQEEGHGREDSSFPLRRHGGTRRQVGEEQKLWPSHGCSELRVLWKVIGQSLFASPASAVAIQFSGMRNAEGYVLVVRASLPPDKDSGSRNGLGLRERGQKTSCRMLRASTLAEAHGSQYMNSALRST